MTIAQRILIVDDEPNNRALLEVMLAPDGYALSAAAGGAEALAKVATQAPDLVLLDVMMPGMDGYQVVSKLKESLATRNIPIIMVSALDDHHAKMFGLGVGAEDFLSKPVDRAELRMRVRNLLRLKAGSDAALARRDASMGVVGHELRNLLHGIGLNATLVAEVAADGDDRGRIADGVKRIQRGAARMSRLVGDLVDIVGIDAGKLALRLEPGDAVALVAESVEACALAASAKGISVESETLERALPATFDHGRILQVLSNLTSNALKFTPRGGKVVIGGRRVNGELHLSVRDTGSGIPREKLEAVFERFLQLGQGDGVGLGLYISKCIVESHGGRIWAESTVGEGSAFFVTIPAEPRGQP